MQMSGAACLVVRGYWVARKLILYLGDFMLWCLVTAGRCCPLASASCCRPGGFGAKFGLPKLMAGFMGGGVGVTEGVLSAVEGGDDDFWTLA